MRHIRSDDAVSFCIGDDEVAILRPIDGLYGPNLFSRNARLLKSAYAVGARPPFHSLFNLFGDNWCMSNPIGGVCMGLVEFLQPQGLTQAAKGVVGGSTQRNPTILGLK